MTDKEMFRIWAPVGKRWTDWVRPVPFVQRSKSVKGYHAINKTAISAVNIEKNKNAAIIIDLPDVESIVEGIALAHMGYRPIPIYNGTFEQKGSRATVDNQAIRIGLAWGANELTQIEIDDEALPVFLIDSNRMNRYKMEEALFDNSWDVYPQDLPSADYLLKNGIQEILVVGDVFSKDLKKILYSFQKKKIDIFFAKRYEVPKKVKLHRPWEWQKN